MKKPMVFNINVEITEGQDEWWEEVAAMKTSAERRAAVKECITRCLSEYGFSEGYNTKVKVLPNKRKRVYCGE
jgi:hypothetical protein